MADLVGAGYAVEVPFKSTVTEAGRFLTDYFHCQRGGACCTGSLWGKRSGVPLTDVEVNRLAALLGLDREAFLRQHCTIEPRQADPSDLGVKDVAPDGTIRGELVTIMLHPCPFYELGRCRIHEAKPFSCQLFPIVAATRPIVNGEPGNLMVDTRCPGARLAIAALEKEATSHAR